jgi:hypothetical protein
VVEGEGCKVHDFEPVDLRNSNPQVTTKSWRPKTIELIEDHRHYDTYNFLTTLQSIHSSHPSTSALSNPATFHMKAFDFDSA